MSGRWLPVAVLAVGSLVVAETGSVGWGTISAAIRLSAARRTGCSVRSPRMPARPGRRRSRITQVTRPAGPPPGRAPGGSTRR